ncbi:MAG: HAD family hydrolase [Candidatus Bathyarchaeota archaeon]|nr:HAD family hydrolase [Candidatus Bathyarchaeota archaeon]
MFRQVFSRLEVDIDKDTVNAVSSIFRDSHFMLYDESIEAVLRLKKKGLKTAICTTTPKPFFIEEIEPITKHIDFICTSYEAGYEKSNPQIYNRILDRINTKPSETVVIGDNPTLDMYNAKQLGFHTIQVLKDEEPSSHADSAAQNVLEAVKILETWI